MRNAGTAALLLSLIAATTACGGGTPMEGPQATAQALAAEVPSPAGVRLTWAPDDSAESYVLEARYGGEEYFVIADLLAGRDSFTHFLVPGPAKIDYRLSARTGSILSELDTFSMELPEFVPNPLLIESQTAFAPSMADLTQFPVIPTMDPTNPDLNALATAIAAVAGSAATGQPPEVRPVSAENEVGPEGGTATVTDPNGIVYALELPPGAVDQPTMITLTPIESFSDYPFRSAPLGAVQIHPPIPFAGPAILTITLPGDTPAAESEAIVGFAVSSFNHEFSMAPIDVVSDREYRVDVYWGDTFGLAAATPDEIEAQAARIPSDWQAQMAQQLAALRAADPDRRPEGDARITAQVLQAIVSGLESLSARPSPGGSGGLAAPAPVSLRAPDQQGGSAAKLLSAIIWSEAVWDFLNQMLPPGASPPPGSELARSMSDWETRIVSELTGAIKAYTDEHDGCRTGLGLYAEALRRILRTPGTPFQRALASEYRARYGPPPDLQCEFWFRIVRSSMREFQPGDDYLGDDTETYSVHSEPWTLEMAIREGRLFLQGPVGVQYDAWEVTHSTCPPTMQLRPLPSSLVWITDLTIVFDDDERVSDLILQGVSVDQRGTNIDSLISVDQQGPNECRVLSETSGTNPVDVWGLTFSSLHNRYSRLDNWVIDGEESYTATDTIAGRVESQGDGQITEDTTIVLTVNQK